MPRRRECQSIPVDLQAVFHYSKWEPTVLTTSNLPIPCAPLRPSLCAILRRPGAAPEQAISAGGGDARDFLGLWFEELRGRYPNSGHSGE